MVIEWSLVIGAWSFQRLALVQTSHDIAHAHNYITFREQIMNKRVSSLLAEFSTGITP